ncbi:unnamed protein product [Acanthoscelides obtectus]|uniref:Transposase n=1 Tax=Acanthoscelides obtectus TaxID=200917 RepID=A0A9P0LYV6_ACAOB|nr:unnamed protein product [Acanthoscelides obtectus]CAK1674213.1 Transposable element Tc1 transposase [Acanthoscelides obtectus]
MDRWSLDHNEDISCKNRLRWAKEHRQWTPQEWCAIQWSDEAQFEIKVKFPASIMVWGSMSSKRKESLLPVMNECLSSGQDIVFQQDGAACHTSKKAIKWMEEDNVPLLKWTARSNTGPH